MQEPQSCPKCERVLPLEMIEPGQHLCYPEAAPPHPVYHVSTPAFPFPFGMSEQELRSKALGHAVAWLPMLALETATPQELHEAVPHVLAVAERFKAYLERGLSPAEPGFGPTGDPRGVNNEGWTP